MNINPCIYDNNSVIVGCITDSVIERFKLQFQVIQKKYYDTRYFRVVAILQKTLLKSQKDNTADFLNCLKLISRFHREDIDINFVQDISRIYHNLVRYCVSDIVRSEIFEYTISLFRKNGIQYQGIDIQGVDADECAFVYEGVTIGVKLREKRDLYNFWKKDDIQFQATVYAGSDKYVILPVEFNKSRQVFFDAIKACVFDSKQEQIDTKQIANEILDIAEKLSKVF